jgi:hypothetical protein
MTNRNEDMRRLLDSLKPYEVEAQKQETLNVFETFAQWGKVTEDEDVEDETDDADADTTATADEGAEDAEDLSEDTETDSDDGDDEDLDETDLAEKISEAIAAIKPSR